MAEVGEHPPLDAFFKHYGKQWLPMAKQYPGCNCVPYDLRELVVFGQIDENGRQALTLVRVYCTGPERHTHVLLPDFLIPYVHHLRTTYEQVLHNEETRVYLVPSTLHRIRNWWKDRVAKSRESIRDWLGKHQELSYGQKLAVQAAVEQAIAQVKLKPVISYLVNGNHWHFSRLAKTSP